MAALFSPEHGFLGREDRPGIQNSTDATSGIKVYSLYGETLSPTPEMLRGLDALVFDIQDIGARFYTYESTMAYAMGAAAKTGIPYYVLDRPNPITGTRVEGPLLDAMQDWNRGDWFDSTDLPWTNPSPNMRSLKAATLYPGLCLLESSKNYSVGRGTDAPFEQIGADFIGGRELAAYLNKRQIPGVRAYPTSFTPTESNFKGARIEGVRFEITNRELFDSTRLGLEVAAALQQLYPGKIDFSTGKRLIGSDDAIRRLQAGETPTAIQQSFLDSVAAFVKMREPYLLYR